jgi:hypothetical protein
MKESVSVIETEPLFSCGTVAKSRNSLHSHMSRQHRGISTKDLPVLPMPAPFDPQLAARLLTKAGLKYTPDLSTGYEEPLKSLKFCCPKKYFCRDSPVSTRRGEGSGVEGSKGSSPKSGTSATGLSIPLPPKPDPGTTGSAILGLIFISTDSDSDFYCAS